MTYIHKHLIHSRLAWKVAELDSLRGPHRHEDLLAPVSSQGGQGASKAVATASDPAMNPKWLSKDDWNINHVQLSCGPGCDRHEPAMASFAGHFPA
jgi:hypothetical protein